MRKIDINEVERFFLESRPLDSATGIAPRFRSSLADMEAVPFMADTIEGLTIRINKNGAAVEKDGITVASIGRLNELAIDVAYRGKGLAEAMIVAWAMANPRFVPSGVPFRSKHGAVAYKKAWKKLKGFYSSL